MINKYSIKNILLSIVLMGIVSVVTLVILGGLTYFLKWQAPQAMLGITLTYILTGLAGGMFQGVMDGQLELRNRIVHGLILGSCYMLILLILSITIVKEFDWEYTRLMMIWILLVCSSVLGGFLSNIFCKKP